MYINEKLYASHVKDPALLDAAIAGAAVDLPSLVNEFCYAFNLRVESANGAYVTVATPNGLTAGVLFIGSRQVGGRYSGKPAEKVYCFRSEAIVQRERGIPGNRSGSKDVRQGKTMRGLIQTVKKNDRPITELTLHAQYAHALSGALTNPYSDYRYGGAIGVALPQHLWLPLVEMALGIDVYGAQREVEKLKRIHKDYIKANAKMFAAKETAMRYCRGSTAIGIGNVNKADGHYLIAKVKFKEDDAGATNICQSGADTLEFLTPLVRVETLPEEYCGTAAICKVYLQGQGGFIAPNPFGVTAGTNKYLFDVDISLDYSNSMQWVVLPMENDHGKLYAEETDE